MNCRGRKPRITEHNLYSGRNASGYPCLANAGLSVQRVGLPSQALPSKPLDSMITQSVLLNEKGE